jgi:hypothetical protein
MAWQRGLGILAVCGLVASACGTRELEDAGGAVEPVAAVAQAITAACNPDTIGLPCDPDGPAGAKLECEGMCAIALNGLVGCRPVQTGALDGVVCGTTTGVGDNACKRHCSGKTCLAANAPLGAACRPTSKSNPCEGQCDGSGACSNLPGQTCEFGRQEQLCTFATCNFAKSSECLTQKRTRSARMPTLAPWASAAPPAFASRAAPSGATTATRARTILAIRRTAAAWVSTTTPTAAPTAMPASPASTARLGRACPVRSP